MRLSNFFFSILVFTAASATAQDKIYKANGEVINAKVKTVGVTTLIYKRYDNVDGPEYTILKKEVSQVKYENGLTDNFTDKDDNKRGSHGATYSHPKKAKFVKKYGDNIISITPGAYTASLDGTINDVGVGICYERQLDERGHISFNLPIMINFSSSKDFNNNYYYSYNTTNPTTTYPSYRSYCFMPGIKFYPATSKEKVRYSLGASAFAMFGGEPLAVYESNSNYNATQPVNGDWHYAMYGFMIANSINIMAVKHLQVAIDLGIGIPVSDNRRSYNNNGFDVITAPWVQFGFKAGYRF